MSFEFRDPFGGGFKIGGDHHDRDSNKQTDQLLQRLVGLVEKLVQNQAVTNQAVLQGEMNQGVMANALAADNAALRWGNLLNNTVGNIGQPVLNVSSTTTNFSMR